MEIAFSSSLFCLLYLLISIYGGSFWADPLYGVDVLNSSFRSLSWHLTRNSKSPFCASTLFLVLMNLLSNVKPPFQAVLLVTIDIVQNSNVLRHSRRTILNCHGGEGGIRTHGTIAGTTDFKSVAFDRSATSPLLPIASFLCLWYAASQEYVIIFSLSRDLLMK